MIIAILALQGAFLEHEHILQTLGIKFVEIRQKKDLLLPFDGIILPGGESTAMGKLLHDLDIFDSLKTMITNGLPVFGTCAGLILLAKVLSNDSRTFLQVMDITIKRNAFGRQLSSFMAMANFRGKMIPMIFIRAPYIESVGKDVEILSEIDGKVVAAREKNMLATAFHPELTQDLAIHKYFIEMCNSNRK
ncbi:MAG: pyridoxal 5'-phosphate synthase glutaminase subunit PdxT [Candidatus Izemoplasmatales bacterium]|jgi:5'-phosphate synthase pdxT subunit|nr:pyridoxal 5'-phosphate synthase glutaminase subunit PdxT [Candidatus Izemoplasmatales bacterium]